MYPDVGYPRGCSTAVGYIRKPPFQQAVHVVSSPHNAGKQRGAHVDSALATDWMHSTIAPEALLSISYCVCAHALNAVSS